MSDLFKKAKGLFIQTDESSDSVEIHSKFTITDEDRRLYGNDVETPITQEEIKVAEIDTSNLITIDEVYHLNNLDDKDKSIYKINEIKNALPDMPNEAKKASVLGMLSVSKIELSDIDEDSTNRINALIGSLEKFTQETQSITTDAEALIAEKEKEIEELKNKISSRKQLQEQQSKLFEDELELIQSTIKFIK